MSADDSKKFQESMGMFLRCSPMIPPPPMKCVECVDFHIITDDLAYCKRCHHPRTQTENSQIRRLPTLINRLLGKVAG